MEPAPAKKVYVRDIIKDLDLWLFLAYMKDLTTSLGISEYKALKDAGMSESYLTQIRRVLAGKKQYRKNIYLHTIIHISMVHQFPFDMSKYWHLIQASKLPVKPKKG